MDDALAHVAVPGRPDHFPAGHFLVGMLERVAAVSVEVSATNTGLAEFESGSSSRRYAAIAARFRIWIGSG